MKLIRPIFARRFVLTTSALVFSTIAVIAVFAPHAVAKQYGFTLDRVESLNEFRAVYTGFWAALGVMMFTAARRVELVVLGNLCAVMLLFQAGGRALSFALDGPPSWQFVVAFFAELSGAVTVLSMRPKEYDFAQARAPSVS